MKRTDVMTRIVEDLDVEAFKRVFVNLFPHLPAPRNNREVFRTMHMARTQMPSVAEKLRFYSHCWLRDEGLPSALPDHLRPAAERAYPVGSRSVGIAVKPLGGEHTPFTLSIRKVMEDAVLETYADGYKDRPEIVKARMLEKRADFKRRA